MNPREAGDGANPREGRREHFRVAKALLEARGHVFPRVRFPLADERIMMLVTKAFRKARDEVGNQMHAGKALDILSWMSEKAHRKEGEKVGEDQAEDLDPETSETLRRSMLTPEVVKKAFGKLRHPLK